MDPVRAARVEAAADAARDALGPSPEMSALQRYLFDSGAHGVDAVMVTRQVMGVGLGEASRAFFNSPFRAAERDFQNWAMDVLALAAETDERQQQLCAERHVLWTPPAGGSVVEVGRDVGTVRPVSGLRLPIAGSACGWRLWAGEGEMSQSPDYLEPVEVEYLYDRCREVLPYLGLPPGWRFMVAPGHSDVTEDPALLAS